jgi:hypothetical protein
MTPAGFVALPFKYWRGTVRFRFQIIANAFHKGQLLVEWDPVASPNTGESQTQYSRVIDITEERDFSIDVAWGSPSPALEVGGMPATSSAGVSNSQAVVLPALHNGCLSLRVFNRMIAPSGDTQPIEIVCWHSCPDLEVFGPTSDHIKTLSTVGWVDAVQASEGEKSIPKVTEQSGDLTEQDAPLNAPTGAPVLDYVGGKDLSPKASVFMHGDPVHSFRTCLKRYGYRHASLIEPTPDPTNRIYVKWINVTGTPRTRTQGTSVPMDLHSYVTQCFAGYRGGYRIKAFTAGLQNTQPLVMANRGGPISPYDGDLYYATSVWDDLVADTEQTWCGTQLSIEPQGNVLDVEIPWYANRRFSPAACSQNAESEANGCELKWFFPMKANEEIVGVVEVFFAVADDWNCFFFRGVPELKDTRI